MTRLQMRTYILPVRFAFARNKQGEKYGYGTASFDLAERWLGEERGTAAYHTAPAASYEKMLSHLTHKLGSREIPKLEKLMQIR